MRRGRNWLSALLYIVLLLAGCQRAALPAGDAELHTISFFAMDTLMDFRVYGDASLPEAAQAVVQDWEARASVTAQDSELARLNRDGEASLSPETASLLETALDLCEETGGILDVTIYPVVRAWGFTTGAYQVPPEGEIQDLLRRVDYRKVTREGNRVTLEPGVEVDLGSVAKGWAGARAADLLRQRGVTSALLNLGGNVQTVGAKPDGSPWRVAVQDPFSDGLAGVIDVVDQAAVTSGGYQRFFEGPDGTVYWHIMDPRTGWPAQLDRTTGKLSENGLASVTIVAEDGAYCDALSTALFIMGREGAETFWRTHQDFGMVLVTPEGDLWVTPDLSFQPEPGFPCSVIGN